MVQSAEIAEALDISDGDGVMHLERVLLADDQRIGLESIYLDPIDVVCALYRGDRIVFETNLT